MKVIACICCLLVAVAVLSASEQTTTNPKAEYQSALDHIKQLLQGTEKIPAEAYARLRAAEERLGIQHENRTRNLDQGTDVCPGTLIPSLPFCDRGTTAGYTNDYEPPAPPVCPNFNDAGTGPDVVYRYIPTAGETVTFSLCGSSYDTYIHVYLGGCPGDPNSQLVCCNDDADGDCGLRSCCTATLIGGAVYFIIVDGWSTNAGNYELYVSTDNTACGPCPTPSCVPDFTATIDCCHGPTLLRGSTIGEDNDCDLGGPSPDQIWAIQILRPCHYYFDMCMNAPNGNGCAWDAIAFLSTQCCGGDIIACGDDGCTDPDGIGCAGQSILLFPGCYTGDRCFFLQPGLYYLHIGGYSLTQVGDYVVTVGCCNEFDHEYTTGYDHGDLPPCNYPTLPGNPAHALSDIAWLGDCITPEPVPFSPNGDACDDGVRYIGLPWTPCQPASVEVTVTAGPLYPVYIQESCGCLFLNGWKDGNLDGDFCDTLCVTPGGVPADEWIVQDALVSPGSFTFTFIDPGVFNLGVYPGVFRWRLTSHPVGREGFGLAVPAVCPSFCGTFDRDFLGEVEDYIIQDAQLQVTLNSFDAVAGDGSVSLSWVTASETENDHFEVLRDGAVVTRMATQGNNAGGHTYTYVDDELTNGRTYNYALVAVNETGNRQQLATKSATPSAEVGMVTEYALHQNYPNPFNPETNIAFDVVESGLVNIAVFNVTGQRVATLVNEVMPAGRHHVSFVARDLPSGVYVYRMTAGSFSADQKMVLLK